MADEPDQNAWQGCHQVQPRQLLGERFEGEEQEARAVANVKVEKLKTCFMVSVDGRDVRQFDFTKSPASVKKAQAAAFDFAVAEKRALMTLAQLNK